MLALVEHPEDLGMVVRSEDALHYQPASIWQLSELRSLAGRGNPPFFTVVFNQCSFGAPYRKPTRLLTNLPDIQHWGPKDWASMDVQGFYEGPLLQHCGCKSHVQLVKKPLDTAFKITGTACYPEKMDQGIATAVLGAWQRFCPPTASCRLGNVLQAGMVQNEGTAMEASEGMVRNEGEAMEANEGMVRNEGAAKENNEGMAKEGVGDEVKEKKDVAEATPGGVAAPPKSRVLPAGKGPPMMAYYKGKSRPANDGGGLNSSGRWRRKDRLEDLPPSGSQLRAKVMELFYEALKDISPRWVLLEVGRREILGVPLLQISPSGQEEA